MTTTVTLYCDVKDSGYQDTIETTTTHKLEIGANIVLTVEQETTDMRARLVRREGDRFEIDKAALVRLILQHGKRIE